MVQLWKQDSQKFGLGFKMPETLYRNIATSTSGYVIAPAGCGKTEAIIRTVSNYCEGKQLILTHTNAGVGALKKRFKSNNVPTEKYHIETIAGWALGWIQNYPSRSNYNGNLPLPIDNQWDLIYSSLTTLLDLEFVKTVILNSYSGLIVDEYQDCTIHMHELIKKLKTLLPCRVLGDPLQGIFDFNGDLIDWNTVRNDFNNELGNLNTPHRWINAGNQALGDWLINKRVDIEANRIPSYVNAPVTYLNIAPQDKIQRLQTLCRQLQGSLCVIGASHGRMHSSMGSMLTNLGLKWVEPNDLPLVKKCLSKISSTTNSMQVKAAAALDFITETHSGFTSKKVFITKILNGTITQRPSDVYRKNIYLNHPNGFSYNLFLDLLEYITINNDTHCKKIESINCMKSILQSSLEGLDINEEFSGIISQRKFSAIYRPKRCIGTTLLLKGLEFDHAVILYDAASWGSIKHLYVALTRGAKSVTIIN